MSTPIEFALNHIAAPKLGSGHLGADHFFALARELGLTKVEIRNDLAGAPIADGTPAEVIKGAAQAQGVTILTINALQRFNEWNGRRETEAVALAQYGKACGVEALVLVPVNDASFRPADKARLEGLGEALRHLKPILVENGLKGFVEPLGFAISSLRSKREALDAIDEIGGADTFLVVHDTFHHHLAGEAAFFPERTGLSHISGVTERALALTSLQDAHRVLVDEADILGNLAQIEALRTGGYRGVFSFEPFAESVQRAGDIRSKLEASMGFITQEISR
ncbi:MAG: TIM barrel protein [Hyphomicrobiales bacterium]|nr:TIM barrel protein [Hyphomicrobiales bacterium]